jgi:AraC-like DNA-binding protein
MRGDGIRIVGDNMSNFSPPQLALVGPWLPHLWKNVESVDGGGMADIVVIKFNSRFQGQNIFSIPEFSEIASILDKSQHGLLFGKKAINEVKAFFIEIVEAEGADRLIKLMQILKTLSETADYQELSTSGFVLPSTIYGENRLSKIINHISNNFTKEISLEELSEEAAMTPSSLCRFFKNRTNKTLTRFINEFRVGKACQMLISGNQTISEICFNSGFNSLTTFNRVFKELKKLTPRKYKEKYLQLNK